MKRAIFQIVMIILLISVSLAIWYINRISLENIQVYAYCNNLSIRRISITKNTPQPDFEECISLLPTSSAIIHFNQFHFEYRDSLVIICDDTAYVLRNTGKVPIKSFLTYEGGEFGCLLKKEKSMIGRIEICNPAGTEFSVSSNRDSFIFCIRGLPKDTVSKSREKYKTNHYFQFPDLGYKYSLEFFESTQWLNNKPISQAFLFTSNETIALKYDEINEMKIFGSIFSGLTFKPNQSNIEGIAWLVTIPKFVGEEYEVLISKLSNNDTTIIFPQIPLSKVDLLLDSGKAFVHSYLRPNPYIFNKPIYMKIKGVLSLVSIITSGNIYTELAGEATSSKYSTGSVMYAKTEKNIGVEMIPKKLEVLRDQIISIAAIIFALLTIFRFIYDIFIKRD